MSHLTNNSKKVLKTGSLWQTNRITSRRPKGLTDEEWAAILKDERLNKLIVLNSVPKAPRVSKETRK